MLVRVASVGVCGSDTQYYEHGRIGRFVVEQRVSIEPLVTGAGPIGLVALQCAAATPWTRPRTR